MGFCEVCPIGSKFGMWTRHDFFFNSSQRIDPEFLTRDVVITQKPDFKINNFEKPVFQEFFTSVSYYDLENMPGFQSMLTKKLTRNERKKLCH